MKKLILLIFSFSILLSTVSSSNDKTVALIDVTDTNILEIQKLVEDGYLTYETLIKIYLDRISLYEDDYNLLITINEEAIEEAKKLDEERLNNGLRSPLHGIPIIVKDNIDVYGMPTTGGSSGLLDNYPKEDASVIKRLKDAGMIVLAKSNMSQFGFSARYSASSFGTVGNIFNNSYVAYGSSGGSAQAVALSLAPVALGTDTNSSIRLPASISGTIGLRPTYNENDLEGVIAYDKLRDTVGPITKNIVDNILLMEVLNDTNYLTEINDDISSLNIGVITEFYDSVSSNNRHLSYSNSQTKSLFEEVLSYFDNNANIIKLNNIYDQRMFNLEQNTIAGYSLCYDFNQYIENTTGSVRSFQDLVNTGRYIYNIRIYNTSCNVDVRATNLDTINSLKQEFTNRIDEAFESNNLDVIIYPSTKSLALRTNRIYQDPFYNNTRTISPVTGYPALNIPSGLINGIPYGFEILAQANNELLIYQVANNYLKNNDVYYTSESYKNHYEISEEAIFLKKVYESDIIDDKFITTTSYNNYIKSLEQIESYLFNFTSNRELEVELVNNYKDSLNDLEFHIIEHNDNPSFVFLLISLYLVIAILVLKILKIYFKKEDV